MFVAIKSFAKENPTMILTLCYVLITAIGTGYSYYFYREFDINIIKFADLSDFLLAAILEPLSLLIFSLIVIFILLAYWFDVLLRKRFNGYRTFVEKRLKAKFTDPIGFGFIIIFFSLIMMKDLAVKNAGVIKNIGKDAYQVKFSENDNSQLLNTLELLGSTSRFVYFYDKSTNKSIVISPENISFMSKLAKQSKSKVESKLKQQLKSVKDNKLLNKNDKKDA